jgi:Glu-tRNA(Gln) amidotransferase subunit E-like FAD-binding protein
VRSAPLLSVTFVLALLLGFWLIYRLCALLGLSLRVAAICPTKFPTEVGCGVAARRKLSAADVKRIRRRVRAGEYQTDIAPEYGVNRKTIRRRLDALERAESERAVRLAEKRRRRQAAREKRKLRDRERDSEAAGLEPSRPRGRLSQQRTSVRNPEHEWLARRKKPVRPRAC